MSELKELLKNKWVNNWNLFFLISLPISAFMFVPLLSFESITGAEISEMIVFLSDGLFFLFISSLLFLH